MTAPSLVQQVIDRCQDALFTGTIRVHTRQADGEIWLLSGILERVRFGVSLDEEAMRRLLAAEAPRIDLVPCLPNPHGGFKKGHPIEGELGAVLPVDLLRFCERHALTCTLELRSGESHGEVVYRLGELVSVRCDAGTERGVALMLEWSHGHYRFVLPTVTLPQRTSVLSEPMPPSQPSEDDLAPDSSAWRTASNEALKRKAEEAFAKSQAEERRLAEEAEAKRVAEEAEAKRIADEAEAKRIAEEAEAKRVAEEAEAKRVAEEAEAKRVAEEAEAKRIAEEAEAKRVAEEAEAKRVAEEAEAKRVAEEAEAKRVAEEAEAKRIAEEAEAKRVADEAEAKRVADEAEAKRVADEAEAKRVAEEAKRVADEVEARPAEVVPAVAPTRPSEAPQRSGEEKLDAKTKRKLAKQRAADAKANRRAALAEQRRLEDEARAASSKLSSPAGTSPASVVVRVRRVVTEYAFVSVPIAPSMMKREPGADGAPAIDAEALHAEAARLARAPGLTWKPAGEPVVEAHPIEEDKPGADHG